MTFDPDKNLTLAYNHLNKPTLATFNGTSPLKTIEWVYDASGNKLKKVVKSGGAIQYTQHYIQGIEYRQGASGAPVIEAIYHPEGRVFYTSATASRYEYSIRDHLGNTRITFSDLNANNKVDVTNTASNEILQENHYYPFGLSTNGAWMNNAALDNLYQYNGKELNNDHGLGMYDYGARMYDPSIARWNGVDALGEKRRGLSPYNYVQNSPISKIDPDGNKDTTFVKGKDAPVKVVPGTESDQVNCHSAAWCRSMGDPSDPENQKEEGQPEGWDNNPENNMNGYEQLPADEGNLPGDRVIYYADIDGNGQFDPKTETAEHSAVVTETDKNGNTTMVVSKMGREGVSYNHPTAPGFYQTSTTASTAGMPTSRAYYRNPSGNGPIPTPGEINSQRFLSPLRRGMSETIQKFSVSNRP